MVQINYLEMSRVASHRLLVMEDCIIQCNGLLRAAAAADAAAGVDIDHCVHLIADQLVVNSDRRPAVTGWTA